MGIRLRMFHGDTAVEVEADKAQEILEVLHGTRTVTDIYIDFDSRKIDEANRRVIDYVWHGRR